VTWEADITRISITDSRHQTTVVNLWPLLQSGDKAVDPVIHSGDRIEVPSGRPSREETSLILRSTIGPGMLPVRVMGQVTTPGVYDLSPMSATLSSALAKAGGFLPGARQNKVIIRRFAQGHSMESIIQDPGRDDIVLMPNDVVLVSETPAYRAGRLLDQVSRWFSPLNAVGNVGLGISGFRRF
jgi:hypothetical protein